MRTQIAILSLLSLVTLPSSPPLLVRGNDQSKVFILLSIWPPQKGRQPEAYILDPVVKIEGSSLSTPINYEDTSDKQWKEFETKYFAQGAVYPLLFGGSQLGSVSVEKSESISCESLTATAKVSKPMPAGLKGMAITSLDTVRLHENWRHLASTNQRSQFVSAALEYLKSHGVGSASAASLKVDGLTATKLRANGPEVLLGNVTFEDKSKAFELFLAIASVPDRPELLIASMHEAKDLEDGVDRQVEKFLDQLDFDGDGMDEIITISGYYESWDYAIYKQVNGVWKQIYSGGGGGC